MSEKELKCELFHDNFQNYKIYHIPKAQVAQQPYERRTNSDGTLMGLKLAENFI